ncbi:MAG: PD-(D/E)XK nuclease family protein, partial [Prevotella sp.]|nr:PD-(D/E)XK nuclease family protein [Prevotella sp.]
AFNSFEVKVEHHDIDILIITDNDTCWVIENKIKSSQHSNQLDKYYDIINGIPVKIGRFCPNLLSRKTSIRTLFSGYELET